MQTTDAQLVRLSLADDRNAFGELVRRYQGLIHGLAYHRVGSFTDAQDIAQESFVKAFRRLSQLAEPDRFAHWLKAIAVNECKMWLRASRTDVPLDEAELLASYSALATEKWRSDGTRAEIRQAVDSLPERSRLIVALHYLSGQSHQQIGEFLGVSANAVAQHLHRARQQLKDMLMAEVEEDYMMNKLPESFTEEVLGRITFYPAKEGYFVTGEGEGGARGMTLAVGEPGQDRSYVTIWMRQDDLHDITLGTLPHRTSELAKGRALDSCLHILRAFGIELKRVVLRLSEGRKCRAGVELTQGKKELTVDLRPSDAMALAARVHAPIFAEEAVVHKGNVGEDDVNVPDEDMDRAAYDEQFQMFPLRDDITNKAFEMLSLDDLVDTVRFGKDETACVLRVWLEADPTRELTFDLVEYASGVDEIFDLAGRRGNGGLLRGDSIRGWNERYKFLFTMLGDDARMRVVREENEQQQSGI